MLNSFAFRENRTGKIAIIMASSLTNALASATAYPHAWTILGLAIRTHDATDRRKVGFGFGWRFDPAIDPALEIGAGDALIVSNEEEAMIMAARQEDGRAAYQTEMEDALESCRHARAALVAHPGWEKDAAIVTKLVQNKAVFRKYVSYATQPHTPAINALLSAGAAERAIKSSKVPNLEGCRKVFVDGKAI